MLMEEGVHVMCKERCWWRRGGAGKGVVVEFWMDTRGPG